jgi:hypothetical protein
VDARSPEPKRGRVVRQARALLAEVDPPAMIIELDPQRSRAPKPEPPLIWAGVERRCGGVVGDLALDVVELVGARARG